MDGDTWAGKKSLLEANGRSLLEARSAMGIGVQGCGYGGMAKALRDNLGMDPPGPA
jgi:hypothetical protein